MIELNLKHLNPISNLKVKKLRTDDRQGVAAAENNLLLGTSTIQPCTPLRRSDFTKGELDTQPYHMLVLLKEVFCSPEAYSSLV